MDLAPTIFFEKQEGSLCAQHALNALLQGPYFTAVDLAEIAQGLDSREASISLSTEGRRTESDNYDDSGFFSIQVIQDAVKIWGLEIVPLNSVRAAEER